jgi:hypothetical protein
LPFAIIDGDLYDCGPWPTEAKAGPEKQAKAIFAPIWGIFDHGFTLKV